MEKETMSRAALGHVAAMGDLYDARTDNFCGISIFKRTIPDEALTVVDNHYSDIRLVHSDTFTEKFSKLDVKAELQVSVLCGLLSLEGSGRYLNDQKNSARAVKSSLLYNIKTKEEFVNIYHEDLKESFALDAIESGIATHVVVRRSWGANSILSCEFKNTDNKDFKEIEGNLSAQLKKLDRSISGKASVDFEERDNNKNLAFDIRIFGDLLPRNQDLPTTFEGALDLMKQMPSLVNASNNGWGKPLGYSLIPISVLKNYLNFTVKIDSIVKSIEEECLIRIVQLFDSMSQAQQQIYDFYQDTADHKYSVTPSDMADIVNFKEQFTIKEAKFRSILASTLSFVRSGKAQAFELEDLLASYRLSNFSPDKLAIQFSKWRHVSEKTAFAKSVILNGATYIGYGASLDEHIVLNLNTKTYILFFSLEAQTTNSKSWIENRQLFLQEVKNSKENKYFAVDCDIQPNMWPACGLSIQVVQNGKVIIENLLEDQKAIEKIPFAICTVAMERIATKPNKRINLNIACTGHNCKPDTEYSWKCLKCQANIEYGFNSFFYCSCGRGRTSMFAFKCTDSAHGVNYERPDNKYLTSLLERLRPFKEMNILILGETGVGKSTWINGFINYLTYDSLKEAEDNDLITLIPSEFTMCDEEFNEITVTTGVDTNECQNAGQSATQECKVYPFEVGDRRIRLIDTPGIGDTRGVETDKKNFQNILRTLSNLDELHGICILLKPNNARLTVMFRFCIKELLTYLHRDASHNIVFCFTNARGTFYRPGDTMPALKNLLKENKEVEIVISSTTIYCYDSEAYRFLAAIKNKAAPVKFPDDEKENFAKSWEKSIAETNRMLKHIATLTPHPIQNTLSLNHAREVIIQLTKPLADISKVIHRTKERINQEKKEIETSEADVADLEKRKMLTRPSVEVTALTYPRTVCTNSKCVSYQKDKLGNSIAKYTTICHDNCTLGGSVRGDTKGDVNLLKCNAMSWSNCIKCHHNYLEHLHTYCHTEDITEEYEDQAIKAILAQKLSFAEARQKIIDLKNQELIELDKEFAQIEKASVKFACFLKHNAITPYNDAMVAYMDHLIAEEKGKLAQDSTYPRKTLDALDRSKASYQHQIAILSKEMERSTTSMVINTQDIDILVNQLKKLKHNGKLLQESLMVVSQAERNYAVYQEVFIPQTKTNAKKKKTIFSKFW